MKKRNLASKKRSKAAANGNEPKRWRTYSLMFLCSLLIVAGFFFAGRQHFSSMDYGMKNSRLRKQIDDLESEKRRLLLQREVAQSPAEIKKSAKRAGFNDAASADTELARAIPENIVKAIGTATAPLKTAGVLKTVEVSAVHASLTGGYSKPEKIAKQTKKETNAE